jgi:prepilin-type processing-associated H-X9-DG protein
MYDENNQPTAVPPKHASWGPYNRDRGWAIEGDKGSYGISGYASDPPDNRQRVQGCDVSQFWRTMNVKRAHDTPLLLDCWWLIGFPKELDSPPEYEGQGRNRVAENDMRLFCIDRHGGSVNGTFFDGSVREVGLKELWTLKWHREYDTNSWWTLSGGVQSGDWPSWMRNFKDY